MSPGLAGAAGAVVTALFAFVVAWRRLSGRIGTTEANKLWDAAEKMREETRLDLINANKRILALEARIAELEHHNNTLDRENLALQRRVDSLEKENSELRAQVEA